MTKRQKKFLTYWIETVLLVAVVLGGIALSGCSVPHITQQCLPVPHYTLAQQKALAEELQAHCDIETNQCDVPEMRRRVTDLWAVQRENAACLKGVP